MGKKSKKKGSKTKLTASPALEKEILTVPELPEIPSITTKPPVETKPVMKREAYAMSSLPAPLRNAFPYLTPKQQVLAKLLCSPLLGQAHLFENWPLDSDLEAKVDFVKQLEALNEACPCGLAGYIGNARGKQSSAGFETMELDMKELSGVGFVLVDDDDSNKENVGDVQSWFTAVLKARKAHTSDMMNLCVVSSSQASVDALESSNYFGLDKSQVSIVQHTGRFPVMSREDAKLTTKDCFTILDEIPDSTDVFFASRVAKEWAAKRIKWVSFCNQAFDASSDEAVTVKAYRLDTRAAVDLYFKDKVEPASVGVLDVIPESSKGSVIEPSITKATSESPDEVSVDDCVDVPSLTAPAASEAKEEKEECACACVVS